MKTQKAAVRSAQAEGAGLAQHFNKSLLKKNQHTIHDQAGSILFSASLSAALCSLEVIFPLLP